MQQGISLKLRGIEQVLQGKVDAGGEMVEIDEIEYRVDQLPLDIPNIKTVYGTLLNFQGAFAQLEPEMDKEPYKQPPKAPILYIKPKNTLIGQGQAIPLPEGEEAVQIGAALAVVIGETATKVSEKTALDYVYGYTIVNDVSLPHESVHRPAVTKKARDGFCPVGPWVVEREGIKDPNNVQISVSINGEMKQENTTGNLVRSVGKLLEDVTEFMTLYPGDVLLTGVPENPPLAKANDLVSVRVEGVGVLVNRVVKETDVPKGGTA